MAASLDDILTTQKNGVVAINAYISAVNRLAGTVNAIEVSANTIIKSGAGWFASVSIINAGTTTSYFYDTNIDANIVAGNRILALVSTLALGVYQVQIPFGVGLAFAPGTGAIITVNYS